MRPCPQAMISQGLLRKKKMAARSCSVHPQASRVRLVSDAVRSAPREKKENSMKKSLMRIVTLAVALAFPMGLFAQTTETKAGTDTKTKKSTNPVTGTQTTTTESTSTMKDASGTTTTKKKVTKKKGKKKHSTKTMTKSETKMEPTKTPSK